MDDIIPTPTATPRRGGTIVLRQDAAEDVPAAAAAVVVGGIIGWEELRRKYDDKWLIERELFHTKLRDNFGLLTEQYRGGRQEVFQLTVTNLVDKYIKAFRELFSDTGYQASVGDLETAPGGKKLKRLYIVLPTCMQ